MKHLLSARDITEQNARTELQLASASADLKTLVKRNTALTTQDISKQLTQDYTLAYALHSLDESLATIHTLAQRLHTFLAIAHPEHIRHLRPSALCDFAAQLLPPPEPLGRELNASERDQITHITTALRAVLALKEHSEKNIDTIARALMPNLTTLLGSPLAARLLVEAGSLARLARMSASSIQMLGARKAVLRSLSTGSKNPKHGIIFNHPYVRSGQNPGKHARILADKIAICARVDYFKGNEIASTLLKQLT